MFAFTDATVTMEFIMHRIILPLLVMLLITTCSAITQRGMVVVSKDSILSEEPYRNKWALLIGVNDYPNLPAQYQLQYAENDVNELKNVLIEHYQFPISNITTLINNQLYSFLFWYHCHFFFSSQMVLLNKFFWYPYSYTNTPP